MIDMLTTIIAHQEWTRALLACERLGVSMVSRINPCSDTHALHAKLHRTARRGDLALSHSFTGLARKRLRDDRGPNAALAESTLTVYKRQAPSPAAGPGSASRTPVFLA